MLNRIAEPWLRFTIGDQEYSTPLESVNEVMNADAPRLIPLVPLEHGGVITFRGEPLPVVNGGLLLTGEASFGHSHVLLFESSDTRIGVSVSRVLRIDRTLRVEVTRQDEPVEPAYVQWVHDGEVDLGLVDADGLLRHGAEIFSGSLVEGREGLWESAF